jgi:hypothetical protein
MKLALHINGMLSRRSDQRGAAKKILLVMLYLHLQRVKDAELPPYSQYPHHRKPVTDNESCPNWVLCIIFLCNESFMSKKKRKKGQYKFVTEINIRK